MSIRTELLAAGILLLIFVPVAVYLVAESTTVVALSFPSVALVAVTLYLAFGPAEVPAPAH